MTQLASQLEALVGKKLYVKINNNRSSVLSVRWRRDYTKISLHCMFQKAGTQVQEALARYLRRDDKRLSPVIRAFIAEHSASIDYSRRKKPLIISKGEVYHLEAIYREINQRYFKGELNLSRARKSVMIGNSVIIT